MSFAMTVPRVRRERLMKEPSFRRSAWPVADSEPARSMRFCGRVRGGVKKCEGRERKRRNERALKSLLSRRETWRRFRWSASARFVNCERGGNRGEEEGKTHHYKDTMTPRAPLVPVRRAHPPPLLPLPQHLEHLTRKRDGALLEVLDVPVVDDFGGFGGCRMRGGGGGGWEGGEEISQLLVVDFEKGDAEGVGSGGVLLWKRALRN